MKVVRLRFDDGSEQLTLSSDPHVYRARAPDDIVVGDLCQYSTEDGLVIAKVVDVADIDIDTDDVVFSSDVGSDNSDTTDCLDLLTEVYRSSTAPPPAKKKRRRLSTSISNDSTFIQDERDDSPAWRSTFPRLADHAGKYKGHQITGSFPSSAVLRVETPNGNYVPVNGMSYYDLVRAFEAKWKTVKLPPIAKKLNIPLAIHHLRTQCLEAFNKGKARSFMYPIVCYLFDMDVIVTAFIPGRPSAFHRAICKPLRNNKGLLNAEATEAFYFLVDYFSTILIDPNDDEHALWPLVVRNSFNFCISDLIKKKKRGDSLKDFMCNSFLLYVIPGHRPIFHFDAAF